MDESKTTESAFICDDEKTTTDSIVMDGTSGDDERTETERSPRKAEEPSSGRPNRLTLSGKEKDFESGEKRKRHRRGKSKKRKWKPYYKLTWQERGELEDRETKRANRVRAERFAHGQPVAPYNTTQFLMEDHNVQEPNLDSANHRQHRDGSVDSSDEYYSSPEDEITFLQKEFSEEYERTHAERLHSMSKSDLVLEYIALEGRFEDMVKQYGKITMENKLHSIVKCDVQTDTDDLYSFSRSSHEQNELLNLRLLVEKLKAENEILLANSGRIETLSSLTLKSDET